MMNSIRFSIASSSSQNNLVHSLDQYNWDGYLVGYDGLYLQYMIMYIDLYEVSEITKSELVELEISGRMLCSLETRKQQIRDMSVIIERIKNIGRSTENK